MDQRIEKAIHLISNDLSHEITVAALSSHVHLSPSRLRYLFKAETGMPPSRYLRTIRMQRARALLENTFLNIKEVMAKIGVRDESHFVRDFKRTFGLTPKQYRVLFASR